MLILYMIIAYLFVYLRCGIGAIIFKGDRIVVFLCYYKNSEKLNCNYGSVYYE